LNRDGRDERDGGDTHDVEAVRGGRSTGGGSFVEDTRGARGKLTLDDRAGYPTIHSLNMPHRPQTEEIIALEKRMQELLAQSDALQERIDELKTERNTVGIVDDTRILAKPVPEELPPSVAPAVA
jgi:hypothetical protein